MDHNTYRENLSAYLDGELPQLEKALLEAHLADCPDCRAVLEQLGTVSGIIKKHVMEPVPLSLKGEVLSGPGKAARPWLKPVLALSTAAVGLLVVMNLSRTSDEGLAPASFGARSGGEANLSMSMPSGEAGRAMPSGANETAAAPAAPAAGFFEEGEKKSGSRSAIASVRGSYGQAKYAAPRAMGSLSGGAGGAKAEAAGGAGASKISAAARSGAEFRGPVCVYVSSDKSRQEASAGLGEEGSDDFFWYLGKALIFLEKTGTPSPSANPGRLVFVKKDGSRKVVTAKDCSLGFVFFDGVQDPLVVTDFIFITDQYNKYFGTSLEAPGDELPD
ncbi:MAG: anti-sigma factor [Elusimicrobiota bacterium]|nr:anti-sigma factor [Elusimicrobiota bacterium]